jgi:Recombination endonuclease VII
MLYLSAVVVKDNLMHFKDKLTKEERDFRSFTGATIEDALAENFEDDNYKRILYKHFHEYNKTPEGKQALWKTSLNRNYRITPDDYNKLFDAQQGKCAICNKDPLTKKLGVDHNHKTSKIRGLLCVKCNAAIGLLKESIKLFDRAKEYLIKEGTHKSYNKLSERRETRKVLLELQQDKCDICGKHTQLHTDHNHTTKEIRGLLCVNCNFAIGSLQDSVDLINKAKEYLIKNSKNSLTN